MGKAFFFRVATPTVLKYSPKFGRKSTRIIITFEIVDY